MFLRVCSKSSTSTSPDQVAFRRRHVESQCGAGTGFEHSAVTRMNAQSRPPTICFVPRFVPRFVTRYHLRAVLDDSASQYWCSSCQSTVLIAMLYQRTDSDATVRSNVIRLPRRQVGGIAMKSTRLNSNASPSVPWPGTA